MGHGRGKPHLLLSVALPLIEHLEGAHHAPHIVGMNGLSTRGIAPGEQLMEARGAKLLGKLLVATARSPLNIACRKRHLIQGSAYVEPCAAAEHRRLAPIEQGIDGRTGIPLVQGGGIGFARLHHIHEQQGRPTLGFGRLRRADIHAAVHLHGVGRDHRGAQTAGNLIGDGALPYRRWTNDSQHRGARIRLPSGHRGPPTS